MSKRTKKAPVIPIDAFQNAPDYYEILQVAPHATHADIIRAYRRARETYKQDSLTTYSLFEEDDAEKALAQIEEAYQVLAFSSRRRLYDQKRKADKQSTKKHPDNQPKKTTAVAASGRGQSREFERLLAETRIFSGAVMRALRKHRGLSLDDIADRTKISKGYLQAIENEDISLLPPGIYRKSFIRQYAVQLGLDPDRVVATYPPLQQPHA